MSELQDKLNSLLSDPAGMAQVVQLAQQLSSTMEPSAAPTPQSGAPTPPPSPNPPPSTALPGGIDLSIFAHAPGPFLGSKSFHAAAQCPAPLFEGGEAGQG